MIRRHVCLPHPKTYEDIETSLAYIDKLLLASRLFSFNTLFTLSAVAKSPSIIGKTLFDKLSN